MVEAPPFAAFSDFGSFGQPSAPPAQPPVATNYVCAPPPRPAPPVAAEPTKAVQRSGSITSSDYPNSMLLTESGRSLSPRNSNIPNNSILTTEPELVF